MLWLPVSVYRYDPESGQYAFVSCMQCVVRGEPLPKTLTSSAGQAMMSDNLELLKAAMRAPALVLHRGAKVHILNAAGEEVQALPPTEAVRITRAYELPYINLSTQLAHYRLRNDGALVLVDACRLQCAMCYVPETMDAQYVRDHLNARAHSIHKLLRDRRMVVEIGKRVCVLSCETLKKSKQWIRFLLYISARRAKCAQ